MTKFSFIIVNLNTKDLIERCIENLINVSTESQIIVVDNNSVDGSVELLEGKFKNKIDFIKSENKGLSHGYNLGLERAVNELIIFLGSDAYPTSEALESLANFINSKPNVGIVTPKLVTNDGSIDWDAHRGLITPWSSLTHFSYLDRLFPNSKLFNGYFKGYLNMDSDHEIDACISHFMLTTKSVIKKVGPWDEEFFLFGEDIDMCYRVQLAGYKVFYLVSVKVLHLNGGKIVRKTTQNLDTGIKKDIKLRRFIKEQSTFAMGRFYKKHLWNKYPLPLSLLVSLGIFLLNWLRLTIFDLKQFLKLHS